MNSNDRKAAIAALHLAANINPYGDAENAKARDAARKALDSILRPSLYNRRQIAWELERTAMGDGYYGNALRVAKDLPEVTAEERSLLDRYANGLQTATDHMGLCTLALKIAAL